MLRTAFLPDEIAYTGAELRAGWAAIRLNAAGSDDDFAVAFVGPCDVQPQHMVDLEDLAAGSRIYSEKMLHFIVEHSQPDLEAAVLRQRILACIVTDMLNSHLRSHRIVRKGDDLFDGERKLSVSIATISDRSSLMHFGVNVHSSDYPLPVKGIADFGLDPRVFAERVLAVYKVEMESIRRVQGKVRRVGRWAQGEES